MRLFVTLLALLCLGNSACFAQRYRGKSAQKKVTVEELISSYRFTEAAEMLEENIAKNKRRRKPVEALESQLDRVHALEIMLSATEKVRFVDSIVVNKKDFLSIYHLGSDCGTIAEAKTFLPENLSRQSGLGEVAYCNELNDKIYYSIQNGKKNQGLHVSARIGNTWSHPKPLKGIARDSVKQDFPYVLADGVTMYYAEEKEEGLGGYDIYVTRYNSDTDSYLAAENLGMPFNSMANDYMYVVDELNNLGWFATDRNQPKDTVCIYIFQPNVTRELYNPVVMGEDAMRRLAMIQSIQESRLDRNSLDKARSRLQQIVTEPTSRSYGEQVKYVISDNLVYYSLDEFKQEEARKIAVDWRVASSQLNTQEKELEVLRMNFQAKTATEAERKKILELEKSLVNLQEKVSALAKRMRKAELKK